MRAQNCTIGEHETFDDWGLWLTSLDEGEALPKTVIVDVPGANGSLDLTEALTGEPTYSNRTVRIGLARDCGTHAAAVALYRTVKAAIHGLKLEIRTPDTGDGWYVGRVTVSEPEMPDGALYFDVVADCDPFLYTGTLVTTLNASTAQTVTGSLTELTSAQTSAMRYGAGEVSVERTSSGNPQSAFDQVAVSFARNGNFFDMKTASLDGAIWLGKSNYTSQYQYAHAEKGITSFLWDWKKQSIRFVSKETDNNGFGDEGHVEERASQLVITAMPMPWESVADTSNYAHLDAYGDSVGDGLAFNAFTQEALDWHVIVNGPVYAWSSDWGADAGVEVVVGRRILRKGSMVWSTRTSWHTEAGSSESYITESHTWSGVKANTILVCVRGITCDLTITVYANKPGTDSLATPSIYTQVLPLSGFYDTAGFAVEPPTLQKVGTHIDSLTLGATKSTLVKNTVAYDYESPTYPSASSYTSTGKSQSRVLDVDGIGAAKYVGAALAVDNTPTDVPMSTTLTLYPFRTVTLTNDEMPAVPVLNSAVPAVIRRDGNTYISASGRKRLPIHIPRGTSQLQYSAMGADATLTWNSGVL